MNKIKNITSFLLLFSFYFASAQESSVELKVKTFKSKIEQAQGGQKLILLDSLSGITFNNPQFNHDSITKVTIAYAIKLDSVNLATKHTASLLYLLNNRFRKPKEGVKLFNEFAAQKLNITDTLALARLYLQGAEAHLNSGMENESLDLYDATMKFALKGNDSILYAQTKGYKAYVLTQTGDFATASQDFQQALSVFIRRKDTANMIRIRGGLSIIYGKNNFYDQCEKELDEIEKLALASKNLPAYLVTLGNKATNYNGQKKYQKSIETNKKALELIEKNPQFISLEASRLNMLVLTYLEVDSLDQAKAMLKRIETRLEASKTDFGLKVKYTEGLARLAFAEKKYTKAKNAATDLLEVLQVSSSYEAIMKTNSLLYKIEQKLGNSGKALKHYEAYIKIKDSIESVQKTNALAYYQTLYETEKRDATIKKQESEIVLLDTKSNIKSQWMLFGGIGLVALFIIIYLVRSYSFAKRQRQMQESFSQDLINEQEKERSRLARELHDSVGQKLMLLTKTTKNLGNENAENLASSTLEEIRSISRGLHPSNLERLGLTDAINALVYDINANTELFFTEEIENIDNVLSKESELHLYRIIQESLSNVVKHAEAKAVKMEIQKTPETVEVFISDNGKGFDINSKKSSLSLGMKTLFERAKIINTHMNLESNLGKGTTITLSIPV